VLHKELTLLPGCSEWIAYKAVCLAFHSLFLSSVSLAHLNLPPPFSIAMFSVKNNKIPQNGG